MSPKSMLPKAVALDDLIRAALEASNDADPYSVVDRVVEDIPAPLRVQYLREAVRSRVPSVLARARASVTPEIRKGVSTKQSLIRDSYWPRFLQQRIFLPDGYKFLAEATAADLRIASAQREAQAQELLFRAEQFSALADLMEESGVQFLEQLDSTAGSKVLERAA